MAKQQPKPDLLRVYTDHEHGGVMRVDYDGRPLGVLATPPSLGFQQTMSRPSMFDRSTVELSIINVGPGFFDPKPAPPFNTVDLRELNTHFYHSPSIERVPA
jgi:hypothetical protein